MFRRPMPHERRLLRAELEGAGGNSRQGFRGQPGLQLFAQRSFSGRPLVPPRASTSHLPCDSGSSRKSHRLRGIGALLCNFEHTRTADNDRVLSSATASLEKSRRSQTRRLGSSKGGIRCLPRVSAEYRAMYWSPCGSFLVLLPRKRVRTQPG